MSIQRTHLWRPGDRPSLFVCGLCPATFEGSEIDLPRETCLSDGGTVGADKHSHPREHWSVEQVKRAVMDAMVDHSKGAGMAVSSRKAADTIIALLVRDPVTPVQTASREAIILRIALQEARKLIATHIGDYGGILGRIEAALTSPADGGAV